MFDRQARRAISLSSRRAALSGYTFAARKSAVSDLSSKTDPKPCREIAISPQDAKTSSTSSDPDSSHSTLNNRVLSDRTFIKLTTCITQVITSLNESGFSNKSLEQKCVMHASNRKNILLCQ